ncbi:hypothetical protein CSOJ01_00307 [Colletotrichum sojae]|uniref:Uncharacterized protein n=1 Tax=Colletotrichum sojae TaxID=2175907 RepID=A0A8H6JYU1_9PEZI|nr:hypothetical protein CSOJ01_00307 [Colletotrichum sojae]
MRMGGVSPVPISPLRSTEVGGVDGCTAEADGRPGIGSSDLSLFIESAGGVIYPGCLGAPRAGVWMSNPPAARSPEEEGQRCARLGRARLPTRSMFNCEQNGLCGRANQWRTAPSTCIWDEEG